MKESDVMCAFISAQEKNIFFIFLRRWRVVFFLFLIKKKKNKEQAVSEALTDE